jgi:hypothetical protein
LQCTANPTHFQSSSDLKPSNIIYLVSDCHICSRVSHLQRSPPHCQHPSLSNPPTSSILQTAFPCVREVDFRQWPPLSCHGPFFADLTSLRRIYISSVQRPSEPAALASEISSLATAIHVSICRLSHTTFLIYFQTTSVSLIIYFASDTGSCWCGSRKMILPCTCNQAKPPL